MGGFKNQREVFSWEGETLELDETKYEHGTLYEIECETVGDARCVVDRQALAGDWLQLVCTRIFQGLLHIAACQALSTCHSPLVGGVC
jgi:hypothetical protein